MTKTYITERAIKRREYWVGEIRNLSGNFEDDSARLEQELFAEIAKEGAPALVDHLRVCGAIPESYGHDSSEEKLYSKYTDTLLAAAFQEMGIRSVVLRERGDSADVEGVTADFAFVADAKSFRLSRTAKNQKDFKVQAMDGWKRGKAHAMVVCPVYQLPSRSSQIYEQAVKRDVCIFTYSHLCVLIGLADSMGRKLAEDLLGKVFKTVTTLKPTKDAVSYWRAINRCIVEHSDNAAKFWEAENEAAKESIALAKQEALKFLTAERERIAKMSHKEALEALMRVHKIDGRADFIKSAADNQLMNIK